MAYGIWEYDYLFYLFIFKVASHCALCADKISAKEKQHKEGEKRKKREIGAIVETAEEEQADRKGGRERKVASNCLENESKRAEKSRKLKMNQRRAPPIAGGNPKQRRTQGGG